MTKRCRGQCIGW